MNQTVKQQIDAVLEAKFKTPNTKWASLMECYKWGKIELTKSAVCFLCNQPFIYGYGVSIRVKGTNRSEKTHVLICRHHPRKDPKIYDFHCAKYGGLININRNSNYCQKCEPKSH